MFNTIVGVKAGAALRYGSGSDQIMRILVAPAPAPNRKSSFIILSEVYC
jgi:hypothetical protein